MPDPEGGLKPRPRRRVLLVLAAAVLLGGASALYLARPGERLDAWARERLRAEMSRAMGRPVSIATVHVSPFAFTLEARDIVVGAAPPSTGRVLSIPVLAASVGKLPLVKGRIELTSVRLDRPQVFVSRTVRGLDGPFPLSEKAGPAPGTAPATPPSPTTTARPSRALRVVLRRLDVADGVVSFEDRALPFWCTAEGMTLVWEGDETGSGSGNIDSERIRGGSGSKVLEGRLHARAALQDRRLGGEAELSLGESSLAATVTAELGASTSDAVTGEAQFRFRLAGEGEGSILPLVLKLPDPLTGTLEGSGTAHLAGGRIAVDARVKGERLRYLDLDAAALEAELHVGTDEIQVRSLELRAFGGRISATGSLEPRAGGMARASFRGEDLSLPRVLEVIGLDSPLDGISSGGGTLSAKLGDPASFELDAAVAVRAAPGEPSPANRYATTGRGTVTIRGRKVALRADHVEAGQTTAQVRIDKDLAEPPVTVGLSAESASLADTNRLLDGFLALQPGRPELPWSSASLEGRGTIEGEVVFQKGRSPQGSGRFVFRDFAYEGIGSPLVTGEGAADSSAFRISGVRAEKAGGIGSIEGTWPVDQPEAASRVVGRFERWPAGDLLARLGAPQDASVRLTGSLELRGGPGGLAGEADLALAEAAVPPVSLGDGRFLASLAHSHLDVSRLSLASSAATIEARGSFDLVSRRLAGRCEGTGIDVALLRDRLHGLPLSGHARAVLEMPAGSAGAPPPPWTLEIRPESDLAFRGTALGPFELDAEGDGERTRFHGALGELARFS